MFIYCVIGLFIKHVYFTSALCTDWKCDNAFLHKKERTVKLRVGSNYDSVTIFNSQATAKRCKPNFLIDFLYLPYYSPVTTDHQQTLGNEAEVKASATRHLMH